MNLSTDMVVRTYEYMLHVLTLLICNSIDDTRLTRGLINQLINLFHFNDSKKNDFPRNESIFDLLPLNKLKFTEKKKSFIDLSLNFSHFCPLRNIKIREIQFRSKR